MSKGKNKTLTLRLNEDLMEELDRYAKNENVTKSNFVRQAILESINYSEIFRNNETLIISKEMLKYLLSILNDTEIETLAMISVEFEINTLKSLLLNKEFNSILSKYALQEKVNTVMVFMLKFVFTTFLNNTGRKWFENVNVVQNENEVTLVGKHSLGIKFSKFIIKYIEFALDLFKHEVNLSQQIIEEDRIKYTVVSLHESHETFAIEDYLEKIETKFENYKKKVGLS